MSQSEDPRGIRRREFLQLIGAAGLAAALPSAAQALAPAAAPTAASPAPAPKPQPVAPVTPGDDKGPSEDALALTAILRRRFPDRLTEAHWKEVTDGLDGRLEGGKRLRASKLANGDEPDFTFKA